MTIRVYPPAATRFDEGAPSRPGPTHAERMSMRNRRFQTAVEQREFGMAAELARDLAYLSEMFGDLDAATHWFTEAERVGEMAG